MKLTLKQAYMSMFYYLDKIWDKVKDDKTTYNIDDMNFNLNWLIEFIYRERNICKKDNIIDEWDECILKVFD